MLPADANAPFCHLQAVSQEQAALRASLLQQRDVKSLSQSKFQATPTIFFQNIIIAPFDGSSHVQLAKMSVGTINDFHRGLSDRIGSANLDFETTMRLEHCNKCGCDQEFEAGNYQITTTPCKEWLYVVCGDNVSLTRFLPPQPL